MLFISTIIGASGILSIYTVYKDVETSNENFMQIQLGVTNVKYIKEDINRIITTCDLIFNSTNGYNSYLVSPALAMLKQQRERLKSLPKSLTHNKKKFNSFKKTIKSLSQLLAKIQDKQINGNEYDLYEEFSIKLISLYKLISKDAFIKVNIFKDKLERDKIKLFDKSLIFTMLYMCFLITLGIFASRIIVQPVKELSKKTTQVISGSHDNVITPSGPLELQLLGEHFIKMINSEKEKRQELLENQNMIRNLLEEMSQEKAKLESTLIELQKVSQSRDHFLSAMSHELRTPLNLIIGYNEALLDEVYGELNLEQLKALEISYQGGQRLLSLISNTLEYSRLLSGSMKLDSKAIKVIDLIEKICDRLKLSYAQKTINLKYNLIKESFSIKINSWILQTILFNLLDNAYKFSHQEGVVTLDIYEKDHYLYLVVSDHGLGVPSEIVEQLKLPFFQVDHGLDRLYDGTGLGLSIVSEIVKLHHGQLHISSKVNQGMIVTIKIPTSSL